MATYTSTPSGKATSGPTSNIPHCADLAPQNLTPPRTPTDITSAAHKLHSQIRDIHTSLMALPNLAPGSQINSLLTHLVNLCTIPYSASFTTSFFSIANCSELCSSLRPICGAAEGELENYWALKILAEAKARKQLQNPDNPADSIDTSQHLLAAFPYYQNYLDLSRLECSTLEGFLSHPPTNVAFIGSGPLPLTSICMLDRFPDASVCNIDRDAGALRVSQKLCQELRYGERMSFVCEDIAFPSTNGTDWFSFQVVFLAALVGTDTESKMAILTALAGKMSPGSLVVARSAWGLRGVLYPVGSRTQTVF